MDHNAISMKCEIAQTAKGPVEFTLTGSGPVVLVLHGSSSGCLTTINPAPFCDAGYSLLSPSRPGYGKTPVEVGPSASKAARSITLLLDTLQVKSCALVAISSAGPTGIALASGYPQRITSLTLVSAVTDTAARSKEPGFQKQVSFYGPLHNTTWGLLGLLSRIAPRTMASKTISIFSTHAPDLVEKEFSPSELRKLVQFYQYPSSRSGAMNVVAHSVSTGMLNSIVIPTLIIHSREDRAVPFHHAEYSLRNIPGARFAELGSTGHITWAGPGEAVTIQKLLAHLQESQKQVYRNHLVPVMSVV